MKFGDALKEYREKRNLTRTQMARLLKVSISIIGQWERSEKVPKQQLIVERLQEMLGREVKEVYELRGGLVHLEEAVGGHRNLISALHWTAEELADRDPEHVKVERKKKEILITLKMR